MKQMHVNLCLSLILVPSSPELVCAEYEKSRVMIFKWAVHVGHGYGLGTLKK